MESSIHFGGLVLLCIAELTKLRVIFVMVVHNLMKGS